MQVLRRKKSMSINKRKVRFNTLKSWPTYLNFIIYFPTASSYLGPGKVRRSYVGLVLENITHLGQCYGR